MAQGIVLPPLKSNMSLTRATQWPAHMDNRDDINWTLPPIKDNRTLVPNNVRQPRTMGTKNKRRRINKFSNEPTSDFEYSGKDNERTRGLSTRRMSSDEELLPSHNATGMDMFNRMSTEAQEAYNEILKEMRQHDRADNSAHHNNHTNITDTDNRNDCLQLYEDNNIIKPQSVSVKHFVSSETRENANIDERTFENALPVIMQTEAQNQYLALPPLLPRIIHTEPSNKYSKKKRRKNPLSKTVPLLECKAPISHTAARVGRKKRVETFDSDQDDDDLSTARPASVIGSGLDGRGLQIADRQFEITPIGYDSRYNNLQSMHACHSEDDEDLVEFVLERATVKCQHWLEHQTTGNK